MATRAKRELQDVNYELFMLAVTFLSCANMVIIVLRYGHASASVLMMVDGALSVFFLFDFFLRLYTAPSRAYYFFKNFGWADLLGAFWYPLRFLRLFRAFRVLHLLREYGGERTRRHYLRERANSVLGTVIFLILVLLEFGSTAVLYFESASPRANIKTAGDALWWGVVTVATVGYGDYYPVTDWGRVVGVLTIITGVGLFGAVTGWVTNTFINRRTQRARDPALDDADAIALAERTVDGNAAAASGEGPSQVEPAQGPPAGGPDQVSPQAAGPAAVSDANYARLEARLARIEALLAGLAGSNGTGHSGDDVPAAGGEMQDRGADR